MNLRQPHLMVSRHTYSTAAEGFQIALEFSISCSRQMAVLDRVELLRSARFDVLMMLPSLKCHTIFFITMKPSSLSD